MTSGDKLPPGAVIAGFEDGETLYVACGKHNRSTCPGKYVPSLKHAFVAWGHRAHQKTRFEILCGYNFIWEKTSGDRIPTNAFPGGIAVETGNEQVYIGRAPVDGNLIPGKVHVHYKTCYIPYKEIEKEVYVYEILVTPDKMSHNTSYDSDGED